MSVSSIFEDYEFQCGCGSKDFRLLRSFKIQCAGCSGLVEEGQWHSKYRREFNSFSNYINAKNKDQLHDTDCDCALCELGGNLNREWHNKELEEMKVVLDS